MGILGLHRGIILKWVFKKLNGIMDCYDMDQDREKLACCCECGMEIRVA